MPCFFVLVFLMLNKTSRTRVLLLFFQTIAGKIGRTRETRLRHKGPKLPRRVLAMNLTLSGLF